MPESTETQLFSLNLARKNSVGIHTADHQSSKMSKYNKKNPQRGAQKSNSDFRKPTPNATNATSTDKKRSLNPLMAEGRVARLTYIVGFLSMWLFCFWTYGDVFSAAEQNSFATFSSEQMQFLLQRDCGYAYWVGRLLLLTYKSQILGSLVLASILTATAWAVSTALRLPGGWKGAGFVVPSAVLAYLLSLGLFIYYRHEPGITFTLPLGTLLAALLLLGISALVRLFRKPATTVKECRPLPGVLIPVVLFVALHAAACTWNDNERVICRMQLAEAEQDWDSMIETALEAKRPSRSVAAFYACALVQQNMLMERLFELPFDFPTFAHDSINSIDEGGNYLPEANFYAGLPNISQQTTMEQMTLHGPSLRWLKRLALCSLLNGEKALTEKYFHIIENTPLESEFVERYRPMLNDRKLLEADPMLARVLAFAPRENKFAQNYRQPTFLGYNMGVREGSNATLVTSITACLYSKDMQQFLMRLPMLRSKQQLPYCCLQAIAIAGLKQPEVLKQYPEVTSFIQNEAKAFIRDAAPYVKDKEALRRELKERWLGTYYYYYYCENNNPNQVRKAGNAGGVN